MQLGLHFETSRTVKVSLVITRISLAFISKAAWTAEEVIVSLLLIGLGVINRMKLKTSNRLIPDSAFDTMLDIVATAVSGKLPFAVSPDNITQSVPSITAFATSVISARVGSGFFTIDSSICVAVITNFPAMLHLVMIIFCASATFSDGISIPRSPRATMIPSEYLMMSSMCANPASFSILLMISTSCPPASSRIRRMNCTSSPVCTNDAAT
mmetsp:Transcript_30650/g.82006  ORF Transcript_30650/g.82006 Transcript_30650/m.82006 type:complete len:212 (+) Transcript_30650:821-1456(+)